jgi:mannitol 2-dehydrogenase
LVVALWCRLCYEGGNDDSEIKLDDPQSTRLIKQSTLAKEDPSEFLQMNDIFGNLAKDGTFTKNFSFWLEMLWDVGTISTLERYLKT